jgi:hypothetical protein
MNATEQKHHSASSEKLLSKQTDLSLSAQGCGGPQNAAAGDLTRRFFIG